MDQANPNVFRTILAVVRKIELPWFILAALLMSTLVTAFQNAHQIRTDAETRFQDIAQSEKRAILRQLRDIEDLMQGTLALMATMHGAQQLDWDTYFSARIPGPDKFGGLVALQYAPLTTSAKTAGKTLTRVFLPNRPGQEIASWKNIPEIAAAINIATETRRMAISTRFAGSTGLPNIYSPVAMALADGPVGAAPDGHLIGIIDLNLLMAHLELNRSMPLTLELFDGEQQIYAPVNIVSASAAPEMSTDVMIDIGQRQFRLRASSTPQLEGRLQNNTPRTILLIGVLGTLLLGGLIWLLTRLREQAESLAANMTRKLQAQTTFTENLIEFNPSPIFRKDAEGRFVSINRAWEQLSGRKREDVLGKTYREFQRADIAERNELLDTKLLASETGYEMVEAFITNADGKQFETIIAKQVLRSADGRVEGLIGTITDVTPIKRLEHELAQQREQLNLVIRSSQQGIWDIDLRPGGVRYFSPRFWEILGYGAGEIPENFDPETIIHPIDRAAFKKHMLSHFKGETPLFDIESRVCGKNGINLWVRTRAIAQRDAFGRAARFVGSISDVTDRKQAEIELVEANVRVMQASRAKEAFLATMSHEIRTPLNGVIGMSNLLAETDLNDEQRDHLRLIHASGDTLLRLIDDVLDFSKIESGHMTLESVPVEVVMVAEEALDLVADKARVKDLALLFDMDDNVPFYILGDATRLRQIFLNLLANAIKFTAAGEIKLTMAASYAPDGALVLEGQVRDTGIGIPADRINKLFQPFTQVDASTTRKYGGTGLGLAICKRLTSLMGGDIRVESVEGEGSVFIFTIQTAVAQGPMKPYMQRNVPAFAGKRVLVVDRDSSRRAIQLNRNAGWGLETVAVAPADAAAAFRRGPRFDILLTDQVMPTSETLELQAALVEDDAARSARGERLVASLLRSTISRAELSARGVRTPLRHDFFIMRPAGRARMFEVLMRAALHEPNQDVATRPFVAEPENAADSSVGARADVRAATVATDTGATRTAPRMTRKSAYALNVLVAEDNEVNQRVIQGMLSNLGHHSTVVGDGRSAVNIVLNEKFDVVLMDIHMPEMDGLAAMQEIRRSLDSDNCPPIIALTAHALSGDREHYVGAGMDDYLSKPVRTAELVRVLDRVHQRIRATRGTVVEATATKIATFTEVVKTVPPPLTFADIDATPILDIEQLEDLRYLAPADGNGTDAKVEDGDPVGSLIRLFQTKALERMALMDGMLARDEWHDLAETSHSLRGASASMGFPRVAILCKNLENAARAAEIGDKSKPIPTGEELAAILEQIRFRYTEAEHAMEGWVNANMAPSFAAKN